MKQITTKHLNIKSRFYSFFTGSMLFLIICSFLGFKYAKIAPAQGDVTLKNCSTSNLEYYFVTAPVGSKYDFCASRLHFGLLSPGQTVQQQIDSGKVLEYRLYTGRECNNSDAKATGVIGFDKATGQTIDVGCK